MAFANVVIAGLLDFRDAQDAFHYVFKKAERGSF